MKKLLILIIVVVVAVVAWSMFSKDEVAAPVATNDQTAMSAELDGLTDADLDAEFKAVDDDSAKL